MKRKFTNFFDDQFLPFAQEQEQQAKRTNLTESLDICSILSLETDFLVSSLPPKGFLSFSKVNFIDQKDQTLCVQGYSGKLASKQVFCFSEVGLFNILKREYYIKILKREFLSNKLTVNIYDYTDNKMVVKDLSINVVGDGFILDLKNKSLGFKNGHCVQFIFKFTGNVEFLVKSEVVCPREEQSLDKEPHNWKHAEKNLINM